MGHGAAANHNFARAQPKPDRWQQTPPGQSGAGLPLLIAAKFREPDEQAYFERTVAPRLGPDVVFLGELSREATWDFLSRAVASPPRCRPTRGTTRKPTA